MPALETGQVRPHKDVQSAPRQRPFHPYRVSHIGQHGDSIGMQTAITGDHIVQIETRQPITQHDPLRAGSH